MLAAEHLLHDLGCQRLGEFPRELSGVIQEGKMRVGWRGSVELRMILRVVREHSTDEVGFLVFDEGAKLAVRLRDADKCAGIELGENVNLEFEREGEETLCKCGRFAEEL